MTPNFAKRNRLRPTRAHGRGVGIHAVAPLLLLGLAMVFLSAGCVSQGKRTSASDVARIEIGKATKADLLRILGLPNKQYSRSSAQGEALVLWGYDKGPKLAGLMLPSVGTIGSSTYVTLSEIPFDTATANHFVVFVMDKREIVIEILRKGK